MPTYEIQRSRLEFPALWPAGAAAVARRATREHRCAWAEAESIEILDSQRVVRI